MRATSQSKHNAKRGPRAVKKAVSKRATNAKRSYHAPDEKPKKGARGRPFSRGNPGRPPGIYEEPGSRRRKVQIKLEMQRLLDASPEKVARYLKSAMFHPNPLVRFPWWKLTLEHTEGKPVESIKIVQPAQAPAVDYSKLTPEELRTMRALIQKAAIQSTPDAGAN